MKKLLMILTSHRLDCLRISLELLEKHDDLGKFDKVVFLMSGVRPQHSHYIDGFIARHPGVSWDKVVGPRGRKKVIADLQNECIRRHPGCLYFKIDEDVFTSPGWVEKLESAYLAHADDADLGLITPIAPNNGIGCYYLLSHIDWLRKSYDARFSFPVIPDYEAPVWVQPHLGEFMTRAFINLEKANQELVQRFGPTFDRKHALYFSHRFTINCICYDYRHYTQMGLIPDTDEPGWTQWAADHGKHHLLVPNVLVHHYSFFVQQDWMDRSHLLEDIRRSNLPGTIGSPASLSYQWPWITRMAEQAPRAITRKIRHKLGLKPAG